MTKFLPVLLLFAALSDAQTTFDVASIHSSALSRRGEQGMQGMEVIQPEPSALTLRNVTLKGALRWAYRVNYAQVQGPAWLDAERWDISARSGSEVSEDQLRSMLQNLLADRFRMEVHHQTKELQAYVLSIGKNGPKFHESTSTGASAIEPQKDRFAISVKRTPISQLTDLLARVLQTPVIDSTGLTGRYDVTIDVAKYLEDFKPQAGGGIPDVVSILMNGIQEELGLRLESKKMQVDLVVVDHAERTPAEN